MPYKSAKQKRLMQAVAHNAAFADKVGIPQSVGRKFEMHKAKGGKVEGLKLFGEGPIRSLRGMLRGHKVDIPLLISPAKAEDMERFFSIAKENRPNSTTMRTFHTPDTDYAWPARDALHDDIIQALGAHRIYGEGMALTMDDLRASLAKRLGRFSGYDSTTDWETFSEPLFAEGGKVDYAKKFADFMRGFGPKAGAESRAHLAAGAASQVMGLNEDGTVGFSNPWGWKFVDGQLVPYLKWKPGMVDELMSLGTFLPEADIPDWAREAKERSDRTHQQVHKQMQLEEPTNFGDNVMESLGMMGTQIPVPGGQVKRAGSLAREAYDASKVAATSPLEFLLPTVEPKLENYLSGALAGGGMQSIGDMLGPDEEPEKAVNVAKYAVGGLAGMRAKYASGGKVGNSGTALRAIKDAISAIQSGDISMAANILKPHMAANPQIAAVAKTLVAPSRARPAREALEKMTPPDVLGLPEGGARAAPVAPSAPPAPAQAEEEAPGLTAVKKYLQEALKVPPEAVDQHAKTLSEMVLPR